MRTALIRRAIFFTVLLAAITGWARAAAESPAAASQSLDRLFESYDRDSAPYFPFSASENGNHAYDSVLANNLSSEYRAGLARLATGYLKQLRAIDKSALDSQRQLGYVIFEYGLIELIEGFDHPWHLLPIDQVGWSLPSRFAIMGAGKGIHAFRDRAQLRGLSQAYRRFRSVGGYRDRKHAHWHRPRHHPAARHHAQSHSAARRADRHRPAFEPVL
jgi:uncharacterized protein (DUF885 family)